MIIREKIDEPLVNSFGQALSYLTLNCSFIPDAGLFHGKMGCLLFFAHFARHSQNRFYEDFAGELLDEVYADIHKDMPVNLENGLCGIGWGIEFLVQNGYMRGDTDDILMDIDSYVMEYDPERLRDFSFRRGLAGIAFYVTARLSAFREKKKKPFDKKYLRKLKTALLKADFSEDDEVPLLLTETFIRSLNGESLHIAQLPISINGSTASASLSNDYSSLGLNCGVAGSLLSLLSKGEHSAKKDGFLKTTEDCLFLFEQKSRAGNYGIGTYIQQVTTAVKNAKWRIVVVCLHSDKTDSILFEEQDDIVHIYVADTKEVGYSNDWDRKARLYYRNVFFLLRPYIEKYDGKLFHLNYMQMAVFAEFLKNSYPQSKVITTVHYTDWSFNLLGDRRKLRDVIANPGNKENESIRKSIENEKQLLQYSDRIIAIAQHSYDDLLDIYGIPESKLCLIPHGIKDCFKELTQYENLSLRQKYGFNVGEQILLFAGRLDPVKGIDLLTETFGRLVREYPHLRLVIAGDGPYNRLLPKGEPFWSKISFTGFVNKQILYELFSICDIGVLPSLHEEFGYVALEMIMMGLPLAVGQTTGLSELVVNEETGLTIPLSNGEDEQNQDSLERVLKRLLDNPSLCHLFANRGRKRFLKYYNFEKFIENQTNCYLKIQ